MALTVSMCYTEYVALTSYLKFAAREEEKSQAFAAREQHDPPEREKAEFVFADAVASSTPMPMVLPPVQPRPMNQGPIFDSQRALQQAFLNMANDERKMRMEERKLDIEERRLRLEERKMSSLAPSPDFEKPPDLWL